MYGVPEYQFLKCNVEIKILWVIVFNSKSLIFSVAWFLFGLLLKCYYKLTINKHRKGLKIQHFVLFEPSLIKLTLKGKHFRAPFITIQVKDYGSIIPDFFLYRQTSVPGHLNNHEYQFVGQCRKDTGPEGVIIRLMKPSICNPYLFSIYRRSITFSGFMYWNHLYISIFTQPS